MKTIKEGMDEAYKEAGQNAYFGNGFKSGVSFTKEILINLLCDGTPCDFSDLTEEQQKQNNEKINKIVEWINSNE